MKTLSRKQIREGLEQTPFIDIMGKQVTQNLTTKQKKFCLEVAKGETGAQAIRNAYRNKGNPKTNANDAYKLKRRPDIKASIQAFEQALEAQKYQTPAHLRALVIQSLVNVLIDPESNASQIINASKVLGTVTEVGAFTERKEITTITTSAEARERVMAQLRQLMKANATDVVEVEADALMRELTEPTETRNADEAGPLAPDPHAAQSESLSNKHTIPPEESPKKSDPPMNTLEHNSPSSTTETPPL